MITHASAPAVRAGIVVTTREPGLPICSFVEYHRALGFAQIFIAYEGPLDDGLRRAARHPSVTLIASDATLHREWQTLSSYSVVRDFIDREVMARQILNAEWALRRARLDGIHWLFHLDSDELLFVTRGALADHLREIDASPATQVVYLNHEAVPETEEVGDYFREVTLFKANPACTADLARVIPFIAYRRGKAAARVAADPVPHGVHRFRSRSTADTTLRSKSCFVLHYPSCGYQRLLAKYRVLGRFEDKWFDHLSIPHAMSFHATARDLVMAGNLEGARALYRDRVMLARLGEAERRSLLDSGHLLRIEEPARQLEGTRSAAGEAHYAKHAETASA